MDDVTTAADSWVDEYGQLKTDSNSWVKEFGEEASKVCILSIMLERFFRELKFIFFSWRLESLSALPIFLSVQSILLISFF